MEIEGQDGSKTLILNKGFRREFGRGLGFPPNERTVSRRHVSFQLKDEARVYFEVIGKNPIWVYNSRTDEIRAYRRFERGEMEESDMFCISAKKPVWFTLKRVELEGEDAIGTKRESGFETELAESLQISPMLTGIEELETDSVDVSNIDLVKEFGFVVMGHEFDTYPKKIIHDIKNWDWFLEEPGEESEDDEVGEKKGKKGMSKKRKKGKRNDDDDDWTGDSEDDKELITKSRKVQRPKYSTRSEDPGKSVKDASVGKISRQNTTTRVNENDIEDDENDDTLGGFIVDDEDVGGGVESDEDEDEDEEEEEEDYDEDDEDDEDEE